MKASIRNKLTRRKRRIERRLRPKKFKERSKPMLAAANIQYDVTERSRGLAAGGIGSIHLLGKRTVTRTVNTSVTVFSC